MIQRTIREWETIRYGPDNDELPMQAADRIAAVAATSMFSRRRGVGVLEHGRQGLRAQGIVGVIAADGCQLEILPKIDSSGGAAASVGQTRRRLVHMLGVALNLKVDVGRLASLDWQRETILEILIKSFIDKLHRALRLGMPKRYTEHGGNLPVARGRIEITQQYTALLTEPSSMACRFDDLTADVPINQMMKVALVYLTRLTRSSDNYRRLRELACFYRDVADLPMQSFARQNFIFDRTNARWRELYDLVRALLGHRFQATSSGRAQGFSLLFDMSALFEGYVAQVLQHALKGTDLHMVAQGGKIPCLQTPEGDGLFETRPDILIKQGDRVVQVIDTKWKRLIATDDDPKHGISQTDVYQMMAYGHLYACDSLMLLYPHPSAVNSREGLLGVRKIVMSDHSLQIATIDMGATGDLQARLRSLLAEVIRHPRSQQTS